MKKIKARDDKAIANDKIVSGNSGLEVKIEFLKYSSNSKLLNRGQYENLILLFIHKIIYFSFHVIFFIEKI